MKQDDHNFHDGEKKPVHAAGVRSFPEPRTMERTEQRIRSVFFLHTGRHKEACTMNGYVCIADLGFYLRAFERGLLLMVIIVLVFISSIMKNEPLFSF